jgi:hypothetical protein
MGAEVSIEPLASFSFQPLQTLLLRLSLIVSVERDVSQLVSNETIAE